ncbi:MAG: hypothetical protein K2R98_03645 [Gemmataceae bacterium]|nr:hypothetical protein [Gemmataceae bacterium]
MTRWPAVLLGALASLLVLGGPEARAAINWTYEWTATSDFIVSDNGQSKIQLTPQPLTWGANSSDIVAVHMNVLSTASDDAPDKFTHQNYSLTMKLTDVLSGAFKLLTFTGFLDGTVSAHTATTTNSFNSPTSYSNIPLGNNVYSVVIGPYTGPGPQGGLTGAIGGHVTAQALEPSTLALAAVGFSCTGLAWLRKRRAFAVRA